MKTSQPTTTFLTASAAACLLALLGVVYLVADIFLSSGHVQRAFLWFGCALIAACIASMTSPRHHALR
jgi:hypothetical protein